MAKFAMKTMEELALTSW